MNEREAIEVLAARVARIGFKAMTDEVAGYLGDQGEYGASDEQGKEIIRVAVRFISRAIGITDRVN